MRIAANNQQRSLSDERLIKGVKREIGDCRDELKSLKRKVVTLEDKAVKQAKAFETESGHYYDLLARMEVEIQQLQDQRLQDSHVLEARNNQYNLEIVPDRLSLLKLEKKPTKSFGEFGFRWREQEARVDPPMRESEMVDYFLQTLEPTYFGHLVTSVGKSFNEVVKIGGMIEEGLNSNKILSYSALKATTQAIQSGTGGVLGKKKKQEVATVEATPNPPPRNLDHSVSCEYCSRISGHDTEKCWKLKNAVQELIDNRRIEVQALEAPNINQNPLPAHHEANMIELIHKGTEPKKPSQTVMMIRSTEAKVKEKTVSAKPAVQPKEIKDKPVLVMGKGPFVAAKKPEPVKLVVPGSSSTPVVVVKGAYIEPVVMKPVVQLPMVDSKVVSWKYEKCEDSMVTRVLIDNGSSANICTLSTLNKLKIDDDRIHKNSVCVRGFDGGGTNIVGDIILELTIGPVEFAMEFQVLDAAVSYNLLLGRPWIHAAKAEPSTLYQMVKFEWDRQEIVLHGKDPTCTVSDAIAPFIGTNDDKGP
ncbi:uncharacterized protein [Nicotiana sylvestris]|uniref:uncharacterized protein n=1 Tax=Nicotiana sylvestris TaxID=4096 RepID=UPI00388C566B